MAGLLKDEFVSEVMTELSWIMRVIDDLCEKTGLETYESTLIKYRVQPEEAHAIEKFFNDITASKPSLNTARRLRRCRGCAC